MFEHLNEVKPGEKCPKCDSTHLVYKRGMSSVFCATCRHLVRQVPITVVLTTKTEEVPSKLLQ